MLHYLKGYNIFLKMSLKIKKIKPEESSFGQSFDGKFGDTDFYEIYEGEVTLGELEIKADSNGVEILSVFTNKEARGKGVGKFAADSTFKMYKTKVIKMLTTSGSRPFWKHIGAVPLNKSKDMYVLTADAFYKKGNDKNDPAVVLESTYFFKQGQIIESYDKQENGIIYEGHFIPKEKFITLNEQLSLVDEKRVKDIIRAQLKYFFWQLYTKQSFMLGNI